MLKSTFTKKCIMITMITTKSGSEIIGGPARVSAGINAGAFVLRKNAPIQNWPQASLGSIAVVITPINNLGIVVECIRFEPSGDFPRT